MEMADRYDIPVLSLVETAGAYPGIGAEERGQAEAIARSTDACLALGVPNVAVVIGEGGSGGAIALAAGDRVLMLEHSIYSVISPEGCASILWRDAAQAPAAAEALRLTAEDLRGFGIVDHVIPEPLGGAHRLPGETVAAVGEAVRERGASNRPKRQRARDDLTGTGQALRCLLRFNPEALTAGARVELRGGASRCGGWILHQRPVASARAEGRDTGRLGFEREH